MTKWLVAVLLALATTVNAQTVIRGPGGGNPPAGTSLPANCTVGQIFFKTDATAGQALYECSAANTWTQQLNSGSAGASAALDNLASVNANTSILAQTGVDLGSAAKSFRFLFLFGGGTYSTTSVKFTSTPTGNRVVTVPDVTDTFAMLSAAQALTGKTYEGLTITTSAGGVLTVAAAKTLTFSNTLTFTGTDSSTVAFGAGGTVAYLGANVFTGRQDATGAASTAPIKSGTATPGTCVSGADVFFKTNATAGQNLYFCTGTNTWTQMNGAGLGDALVANPLSQFAPTTSAQVAATVTDETGTNKLVMSDNPVLVAPTLGAATATTVNKLTITTPASGSTLTILNGKTLTANNTLILAGTDGSTITAGAGGTVAYQDVAATFTARVDASGATSTAPIKSGTSLPATCVSGKDMFYKANATSGQNLYFCNATDTWTQQLNTGSSGGDASTNTSTSVDSEIVIFSGTSGKTLKRETRTGVMTVVNGVSTPVTTISSSNLPTDLTFTSITTTYSATYGLSYLVTGTSADYTVTLPVCDSGHLGSSILFRMSNALTKIVTLDGLTTDTIDGALTRQMWAGETATIVCQGAGDWNKVNGRPLPMMFTAERQAAQTVSASSQTKLAFDTTTINVGAMWDAGNTRGLIRRSGNYSVSTCFAFDAVATTAFIEALVVKNATIIAQVGLPYTLDLVTPCVTKLVPLVAGDTIETDMWHTASGTRNTIASASYYPFLTVKEESPW